MSATPSLNRWLAAGLTAVVVGGFLLLSGIWKPDRGTPTPQATAAQPGASKSNPGDWTMYGGTPARNFINTNAKGLATSWDVKKGTNVRWSADLGSRSYGGPIVAGGRVFVGTNNMKPRDPKD